VDRRQKLQGTLDTNDRQLGVPEQRALNMHQLYITRVADDHR